MNFNTMLDDVYNQLGSSVKTQLILPDPILEKNTVRIVWKNCKAFLKITKTSPEHFFDFMRNQIDKKINIVWFSESISEGLIIHDGRTNIGIMSNKIVALMKKYIEYYKASFVNIFYYVILSLISKLINIESVSP